jgi:hypothetical protein
MEKFTQMMDMVGDFNGGFISGKIDTEGNPVRKTSHTNPYNYDTFIMIGEPNIAPTKGACYSDRLMQWDFKKHDKCLEAVFGEGDTGQYWSSRSPEGIEKFLRLYFDDSSIELVRVLQGCNASNGYPFWVFEYNMDEA